MEVLIAMTLLAAAGAVSMYAFTSSTQVTAGSSDYNVAYNFARGVLEQFFERVRADQWADTGRELSLAITPARPAIAPKTLNGKTFNATYQVNVNTEDILDFDGDLVEDVRRVDVVVTWT